MYDTEIIEGTLSTLDKCLEITAALLNNSIEMTSTPIEKLIEEVSLVKNIIEPMSKQPNISKNYGLELCQNMLHSLEKLKELVLQDRIDAAKLLLKCECISILKMQRREIDYFYNKVVNEDGLKIYFEEEKRNLKNIFYTGKKDPEGEFPYDISIVVLFYNNKDITRLCIDSIYKYTENINYELITVNNGSDEETTAWAETLPHCKKINLKYNIGSSRGGTLALMPNIFDGRFTVYLSNDVIVTKNWLTSLLDCIKSDTKIAFVSPVYNSSSNRQTIPVNYTSIEEMQQFAEKYNQPNPLLWEDRARLFGIAMILRPWAFEQIGGLNDLYFSYDMFSDDDLCVKLNQAGYRMVLCRDTFVHHFGSATLKEGQFEVMEKGRRQFHAKHGFDSWGALGDKYAIFTAMMGHFKDNCVNILAVNPRYGEEFLMLKNTLRSCNITNVNVDVFNTDKLFQRGLEALADNIFYSASMSQLGELLKGKKYDIIMLCEEAAGCFGLETFIRTAVELLNKNGRIFLVLDNMYSRNVIYGLLTKGKLSEDYEHKYLGRKALMSLKALLTFADDIGLKAADIISLHTYCNRIDELEQPLEKILRLDITENINCFNTMYYALGFELK